MGRLDPEQRAERETETTAGAEPLPAANVQPPDATRTFTRQELAQRRLARRAIEAAIWGMPLVSVDAIRQAYLRDAGAGYHDVVHWSGTADWRARSLSSKQAVSYALFFTQLARGPAIVELPRAADVAVRIQFVDAWNVPVLDAEGAGPEATETRFILLPPGYAGEIPAKCTPVAMPTNNAYVLLRLAPTSDGDGTAAHVTNCLRQLRVHAHDAIDAPEARLIELDARSFDASVPRDARFYDSLARMVGEEPVQERDLAIMGQLRSLGIGKELAFAPDAEMRVLLEEAIAEARALVKADFATSGILWWRDRQWRSLVDECVETTHTTFGVPGRHLLLDERATTWFATVGPASASAAEHLQVKTHVDRLGARLDGAHRYLLHVPPKVPATKGWSVAIYDADTGGCLRDAPVVALSSELPSLQWNDDGSVDLYFAPQPPEEREGNWIATAPACDWFVRFTLHGVQKEALERSWTLEDVAPIA